MTRQLVITTEPINEAALLAGRILSANMGAAVYFLGVVRGTEENAAIRALEYEAFQKMVEHQFNRLFDEMEKRWPVESVRLLHRVGVGPCFRESGSRCRRSPNTSSRRRSCRYCR